MTCREIADFVMDYFDGTLAPEARTRFDRHLAECPDCVRYLEQYRDTVEASQTAFGDDVPTDVPEDLVRAILDSRKQP